MKTSYRLDARETLPRGVRRLVDEQLADAVARLRGAGDGDRDKAVHEARKATKKSRAVLRLVRDEIGGRDYRRENRALRDAARRLSGPRDAAVLVETVDALQDRLPLTRRSLTPLRDVLEERRRETTRRVLDQENAIAVAAEEIEAVRLRVENWRLRKDDFSIVAGGLRRTYERGRDRFAEAQQDPTDERMHEARKRVKDLWYHARVVRPIWSGPMGALVDATDELSDLLGEDHDLAVLADTVRTLARAGRDEGAAESVLALVSGRRVELRASIWPLGRRVYAEKPKPFVRRIGRLYDAWREETEWRLSPEAADLVRDLLAARHEGTPVDQRRARDRLRRHGIRVSEVDERLPTPNGSLPPAEFDELVEHGRVRLAKPDD